jgi:hypothetical protein
VVCVVFVVCVGGGVCVMKFLVRFLFFAFLLFTFYTHTRTHAAPVHHRWLLMAFAAAGYK